MKKIEILGILAIIIGISISLWIGITPLIKKKKPLPKLAPAAVSLSEEAAPGGLEPAVAPEEEALAVRALKVELRDFEDSLPVLGSVKGHLEIELKFETNGVIRTIEVKEAKKVRKGDLIATLEDTDPQLKLQYSKKKLESAKAQTLSANKKKEVAEGLYKAGAIIKQKLEEAMLEAEAIKSQEGMAEAEIRLAEAELRKTFLLAPKDGIIGSKDVEAGEFVTPQNKVVSLYDLAKVYVELGVVEKDIEKVKISQRVEVQLDSYPNELFVGEIENILPVIEGRSRTITVKVLLDNPKGILLPGMFSRAKIYLTEIKDAIFVPKASVIPIVAGESVVPVINLGENILEDVEKGIKPGTVELRKVVTGYASTDYIHIVDGLSPGDLVIIEARGELKDGIKVKVVGFEELVL